MHACSVTQQHGTEKGQPWHRQSRSPTLPDTGQVPTEEPAAPEHDKPPLPTAMGPTRAAAAPTSPTAPSSSRQLLGPSPRACAPDHGSTKSRCRDKDKHFTYQQCPGRCSTAHFPALVRAVLAPWIQLTPINLSREVGVLQPARPSVPDLSGKCTL